MLGSLFRRLTGQRPDPVRTAPTAPLTTPDEMPADLAAPDMAGDAPANAIDAGPPPGGLGKSPVFSSRAVRDAAVVTGIIESLNRLVAGEDALDDLIWRLESLTPDQVNFLQLSAEPGLVQRAQARADLLKGAKAAALRKLLADLASGAIPAPADQGEPLLPPMAPILPPLASMQGRAGDGPAMPGLTTAPPLSNRPIPPAPARPAAAKVALPEAGPSEPAAIAEPVPPLAEIAAELMAVNPAAGLLGDPLIIPSAPPKTDNQAPARAAVVPPATVPAPPPKAPAVEMPLPEPAAIPAAAAAVPRLDRQDAEVRRARLLASLTDTLSSSEAAP